jgi:hypothetical protein
MRIFMLILLFVLFVNPNFSQPSDPPGGDGGGDPVGDDTDVPFGIEWLVIGGVTYGITKFRKNKNKKNPKS